MVLVAIASADGVAAAVDLDVALVRPGLLKRDLLPAARSRQVAARAVEADAQIRPARLDNTAQREHTPRVSSPRTNNGRAGSAANQDA